MDTTAATLQPVGFLSLLSDAMRWRILAALARSDRRVLDLAELVDRPINQVSYHLKRLREVKLVKERRSDADARDVYYSLDLDRLQRLYRAAGESLHPALGSVESAHSLQASEGAGRRARILFLCTENSARSQMAVGLLRHYGRSAVEAFSAGTKPAEVHPLAVQSLAELGIDISHHRSKAVDEFLGQSFDYVITVCDRVKEACPTFPGDPERIHWSFPDPATVEGTEEVRRAAFRKTAGELQTMIRYLLIIIERDGKRAV